MRFAGLGTLQAPARLGEAAAGAAAPDDPRDALRVARRPWSVLLSPFDGRFVRFVLVGASNTAVSFCVFQALVHLLRSHPYGVPVAQFVGYSAGIAWSFVWNSRFTFHSRTPVVTRGLRFLTVQLTMALASTGGISLCVHGFGWAPTPSWFVVTIPTTIGNFLLYRYWVFLPGAPAPRPATQ